MNNILLTNFILLFTLNISTYSSENDLASKFSKSINNTCYLITNLPFFRIVDIIINNEKNDNVHSYKTVIVEAVNTNTLPVFTLVSQVIKKIYKVYYTIVFKPYQCYNKLVYLQYNTSIFSSFDYKNAYISGYSHVEEKSKNIHPRNIVYSPALLNKEYSKSEQFLGIEKPAKWKINKHGKVVSRTEVDGIHDIFFVVDENGYKLCYDSILLKHEAIIKYSTITVRYSPQISLTYDLYVINNDVDAISLFIFMADNTTVEWSHSIFENKSGERINCLTTTHKTTSESGMSNVYIDCFVKGYALREHTHNHPVTVYSPFPSGLPGTAEEGRGDIAFAKVVTRDVQKISSITPVFKLYIPQIKGMIYYSSSSVKSDFDYFKKRK